MWKQRLLGWKLQGCSGPGLKEIHSIYHYYALDVCLVRSSCVDIDPFKISIIEASNGTSESTVPTAASVSELKVLRVTSFKLWLTASMRW